MGEISKMGTASVITDQRRGARAPPPACHAPCFHRMFKCRWARGAPGYRSGVAILRALVASAQRHLGCPVYARGYRRQLAVIRVRYAIAGFGPCRRMRASTTVSSNLTPPKAIAIGSVPSFSLVPLRCRSRFTTSRFMAPQKAATPSSARRSQAAGAWVAWTCSAPSQCCIRRRLRRLFCVWRCLT